jgi:hypothetical protein
MQAARIIVAVGAIAPAKGRSGKMRSAPSLLPFTVKVTPAGEKDQRRAGCGAVLREAILQVSGGAPDSARLYEGIVRGSI